ncbi:MAG: formate-dependent phosphoribosylglycinamide formyltransferase [Wolinella succinogenes]|uniref:formate-dependent phosphoribosylglycinamide formyltransferase n=1 Tax=Wolinella succinogenes TaxID=844 RepID=UPI0016A44442|nr:formate-dependent phosphoribosylglycinamide formyltransferase [Wolinella succinogenes]NLU35174.1 formate-dependent phosphoribosylglycinamide formyltransferase [Wolinella succinogenes]
MKFPSPFTPNSIKIMLLGSGELGKEVIIEAQRLGLETIAVDKYENAPAHGVAHRSYVVNMQDKEALLELIQKENPTYILPEVEAISLEALLEAEEKGFCVIPSAKAVSLTMNRKGIRTFAAEEVGVKTSQYRFVKTLDELSSAAEEIGYPCVIKPVMSSSGHGQSVCRMAEEIEACFEEAKEARGDSSELIVEEFIPFDYEITLLTLNNGKKITFCDPIGHIQKGGDYIFSWQPAQMKKSVLKKAQKIARDVVSALGGRGIFGVELFIKKNEVYFSEVSPRPHDTGMVTLITQNFSEFALHLRAVLGAPLHVERISAGASAAFKSSQESQTPSVTLPKEAYAKDCDFRVFGKPVSHEGRRMAVLLIKDEEAESALKRAKKLIKKVSE